MIDIKFLNDSLSKSKHFIVALCFFLLSACATVGVSKLARQVEVVGSVKNCQQLGKTIKGSSSEPWWWSSFYSRAFFVENAINDALNRAAHLNATYLILGNVTSGDAKATIEATAYSGCLKDSESEEARSSEKTPSEINGVKVVSAEHVKGCASLGFFKGKADNPGLSRAFSLKMVPDAELEKLAMDNLIYEIKEQAATHLVRGFTYRVRWAGDLIFVFQFGAAYRCGAIPVVSQTSTGSAE